MFTPKVKPPTIKRHDRNKMVIEWMFQQPWSFTTGDTLSVILGEKEANALLGELLAELARIQKKNK